MKCSCYICNNFAFGYPITIHVTRHRCFCYSNPFRQFLLRHSLFLKQFSQPTRKSFICHMTFLLFSFIKATALVTYHKYNRNFYFVN